MECYDAIIPKKKEDLPKLAKDLDLIIRSYGGEIITASDRSDLDVYETSKGVIISQYYKDRSFFRIWFSGVPTHKFVSELDKLKEKYK